MFIHNGRKERDDRPKKGQKAPPNGATSAATSHLFPFSLARNDFPVYVL
jgi:hypothetical protein